MATVVVKEAITHPDGAVIVVPVDKEQACFVLTRQQASANPVKAGDTLEWDYDQ